MGKEPTVEQRPLSVGALNRLARDILESRFASVWVTGELSRITRAASGHVYFALKDSEARIDAVLWSTNARLVRFPLSEGLHVVVRGQLTVYPAQGRYQLICQVVEPAGEGALRAMLLRLKAKLEMEGLFDIQRKRGLPFLPRAIGVITSETGAAIHDLLQVVWRRFPTMRVILCSVRVQGEGASLEIIEAIRRMNRRDEIDVLVVGRGGGSLEDLWVFNDEALVRAIAASRIPIVAAIGHEIDVTLADLVADVRALTPTEAGERVVPVLSELEREVGLLARRLAAGTTRLGRIEREFLERIGRRRGLNLFPARIAEERQGLDILERTLVRALLTTARNTRERLQALARTLSACSPRAWVRERQVLVLGRGDALDQAARALLARARTELTVLGRALAALNPLAVLGRGFSVTRIERDGQFEILRQGDTVGPTDRLRTTLHSGPELVSEVLAVEPRSLPEAPAASDHSSPADSVRGRP